MKSRFGLGKTDLNIANTPWHHLTAANKDDYRRSGSILILFQQA
jgi:hypothetical protein